MNKKGSLNLSIQAIVIIVIAFVVLGLTLTVTDLIFGGLEEKIPGVFDLTQLESEPTSENPITLGDVKIGRDQSLTMGVGFYNKGEGTASGATFGVVNCLSQGGGEIDPLNIPGVTSISQTVGPSDAAAYKIIFQENGLTAGKYICTIGVKCLDSCPDWTLDIGGEKVYETKQFFLTVIA